MPKLIYPTNATAAHIMAALMAAKSWKQRDVQQELGFNQSEVSKLVNGEISFTKKTEKLIELYIDTLDEHEKHSFGVNLFFEVNSEDVKELAKKAGWQGHGSSLELDQFLLPDGCETEPENAYWEFYEAMQAKKEELA